MSVCPRAGQELQIDGQPIGCFRESFSFISFQSALDDPTMFRFADANGEYALPYSVQIFAEHDCDYASIDYAISFDGEKPMLGVKSGSCTYGDSSASIVSH
ncbi:MAG: hypothetical protein H0T46_10440 [Deltaproteobacteria bacterium]|nr:hypothetical protein [Deltaproteobacteria bacterium]